jgi:hypothetical protein
VEVFLEGLLDVATKKGLKTVKGLVVVDADTAGTIELSAVLTKIRAANPDVLGVCTAALADAVAIMRGMKALDVNPRMVGLTPGVRVLPRFYEALGRDAEYVYVAVPSPTPTRSEPSWTPGSRPPPSPTAPRVPIQCPSRPSPWRARVPEPQPHHGPPSAPPSVHSRRLLMSCRHAQANFPIDNQSIPIQV